MLFISSRVVQMIDDSAGNRNGDHFGALASVPLSVSQG